MRGVAERELPPDSSEQQTTQTLRRAFDEVAERELPPDSSEAPSTRSRRTCSGVLQSVSCRLIAARPKDSHAPWIAWTSCRA